MKRAILTAAICLLIGAAGMAQDYPFYRNIDMNGYSIKDAGSMDFDTVKLTAQGLNSGVYFWTDNSLNTSGSDLYRWKIGYNTPGAIGDYTVTLGVTDVLTLKYEPANYNVIFDGPPLDPASGAFIFQKPANFNADISMRNKYRNGKLGESLGSKHSITDIKELNADSLTVNSKTILTGTLSVNAPVSMNSGAITGIGSIAFSNSSYLDNTGLYLSVPFNGMNADSIVTLSRKVRTLKIEDLTNVDITGLTDGYILKWNAAEQLWKASEDGGSGTGSADFLHYVYHNIESPTSSENLTLLMIPETATIDSVTCLVAGTTPSVTFNLNHAKDRTSGTPATLFSSGQTCTNTTTGLTLTTFNDNSLEAGEKLWLVTTAKSGTVTEFNIIIYYH
jgi:hypothetical protein